ncbi:hypothetical protein DFH06DRAFT_1118367 [Mycena polygramma]|nr:hypothetical protein DFH06DRAFT_1118367 [Mycena polygramma]
MPEHAYNCSPGHSRRPREGTQRRGAERGTTGFFAEPTTKAPLRNPFITSIPLPSSASSRKGALVLKTEATGRLRATSRSARVAGRGYSLRSNQIHWTTVLARFGAPLLDKNTKLVASVPPHRHSLLGSDSSPPSQYEPHLASAQQPEGRRASPHDAPLFPYSLCRRSRRILLRRLFLPESPRTDLDLLGSFDPWLHELGMSESFGVPLLSTTLPLPLLSRGDSSLVLE